MNDEIGVERFRPARMSPLILTLTVLVLLLPFLFLGASLFWGAPLAIPALFVVAIYAWVWLRFRPSEFAVRRDGLEVIWPLKRRNIPRADIASVRIVDGRELKNEVGWCVRIGAGGLWGGFGWLWTKRRGVIQMYVTRTDGFVWIERARGRPWLITPERPETFVRALSRR
jgi:hypothetical protein